METQQLQKIKMDFMDLFLMAKSETSRIYIEGTKVYEAERVNYVGVDEQNRNKIIASVTKSVDRQSAPHNINIKMNNSFKDWSFSCTCKAGISGHCKHTFAVLLHIIQ